MLSRQHLLASASQLPRSISAPTALFHSTPVWRSGSGNYYEILGLEPGAPAASIKKQFYQLSKTHHPDLNPNDPQASDRFVKISEAYGVLGSAQKRERYDRDIQRAQGRPAPHTQRGSHSSSSTPFGSRPASGLSKRRGQFRGPPPSFYRNGGWGQQASKRQAQAGASSSSGTGGPRGGGFGPGQGQAGLGDDVPHFDRDGHSRTQEQQDLLRRRRLQEESVEYNEGAGLLLKFTCITAVIVFAMSIPSFL